MSSAGCLQLKSRKSTNYCQVTGSLLPRTPAELPFLFTGTIETKRSATALPCEPTSVGAPSCSERFHYDTLRVPGLTLTDKQSLQSTLCAKAPKSQLTPAVRVLPLTTVYI